MKFHTCRELLALPPQQWLIDQLVPEQAFTLLYGPSGEGKSFVALSWALSIATGTPWLGHYPTQLGTVVYVACEGAAGLPKRVSAWLDAHADVTSPDHMLFLLTTLDVYDNDAVDEFFAALDDRFPVQMDIYPATGERVETIAPSERLALIVVDTLARAYRGDDENSSAEMSAFIRRLEVLKDQYGTSVLLVHHASRGGNERGSTALRGAMEAVFSCHGTKAAVAVGSESHQMLSRIELTNDKQKDDIEGVIALAVTRVELPHIPWDDQGRPQTSMVLSLVSADDPQPKAPPGPPRPIRKQDMLGLLAVSEHGLTSGEWRIASQLSYRTFARRVEILRRAGTITRSDTTGRWTIVPEETDRPRVGRPIIRSSWKQS